MAIRTPRDRSIRRRCFEKQEPGVCAGTRSTQHSSTLSWDPPRPYLACGMDDEHRRNHLLETIGCSTRSQTVNRKIRASGFTWPMPRQIGQQPAHLAALLTGLRARKRSGNPIGEDEAYRWARELGSRREAQCTGTSSIGSRRNAADAPSRQFARLPLRAGSIDVDARLTPLDPPGEPAAPQNPVAPCCGRRGLRHDRIPREGSSREPRAGERYGDEAFMALASDPPAGHERFRAKQPRAL